MTDDWSTHSDLANYKLNCELIKRHLVSCSQHVEPFQLLFSHVPKTGGTSLEVILAKNFLPAEVLHINAPDLNQLPGLIELKKNSPKLICGHHPMHGQLYQLIPKAPLFHCTMLRDPVERVVSYFNYVKAKTNHPMHNYAMNASLVEFLQQNPSPELANGQAKRFSGQLHHTTMEPDDLFLTAQQCLTECFSLVMTTDLFDESLLLLQQRLQLTDIFYQRANVSKRSTSKSQLTQAELDLIVSRNTADMALYDWAKEQCQRLVDTELNADDIKTFQANNALWQVLITSID